VQRNGAGGSGHRRVDVEAADDESTEGSAFFVRRAVTATAAAVVTLGLGLSLAAGPSHANLFDAPEEKDPIEPFSVFGHVYKKYVIDILDDTGRQIVGRKKGFSAEACVDVISASQQRFRVPGEGGSLAPGGPTSAAVALAGVATGSFASTSTPAARAQVCDERVVKAGSASASPAMQPRDELIQHDDETHRANSFEQYNTLKQTVKVSRRLRTSHYGEGAIATTDEMLPACVPACRSACSSAIDAYDAEQRAAAGFGFTAKDEAKVKGTCAARCAKECVKAGRAYDFIIPWRL
jgi:hypothetical protein